MKVISEELQRIANLLSVNYLRAASIDEANALIGDIGVVDAIIIYTGFGNAENTFAGAMPVQAVAVEVYVLSVQKDVDNLAEVSDQQLALTAQVASDIIYKFNSLESAGRPDYILDPVSVFDDRFIGHLLTFTPQILGNVCSN